jgi:hypothetical protein
VSTVARKVLLLTLIGVASGVAAAQDVNEIVNRSVANNDANWKAAPQYGFKERDVTTKGGKKTTRTYEVTMIDGAPYNKTIAIDGKALSASELKNEDDKEQRERERRRAESPAQKRKRIDEYQLERRQDHALMTEMIKAFQFKLAGKESVNGRECFRVDATPRPGYVPRSRDTKVLTGMRGTLWVDTTEYQWVRVTAAVFRPVAFGLFIAHVQPGTEFTLDEAPVGGRLWMPSHFRTQVKASVLVWSRNSTDDETYTEYHPIAKE